jgi:hypothetical protein
MPRPSIDLPSLHWMLWQRTVEGDRMVRVSQVELAELMAVSKFVVNRAVAELERQRRLVAVPGPATRAGRLFEVADPVEFV